MVQMTILLLWMCNANLIIAASMTSSIQCCCIC
uniref:Uncharacterized protein n=1 Tax=Setaria viridis TaxID=4556 RepID=A0A4U6SY69_SETVI|nr:hypothetical protein SEVIR_9G201450v2 [Setaria viridis]